MTRSELIRKVNARRPHYRRDDIACAVQLIFEEIAETLAQNRRVELRGFGMFTTRVRAPHQAKNPKTGVPCLTKTRRLCAFKPGLALQNRLNEEWSEERQEKR